MKQDSTDIKTTKSKTFFAFKAFFWFITGAFLGLFFFLSFIFILFQKVYGNSIYPGIMVNGVNFGGNSQKAVQIYFDQQNKKIADSTFTFTVDDSVATLSAKQLRAGYNPTLLAQQAYDIGRSQNILSNMSLVIEAYVNGINLSPSYTYDTNLLHETIQPITQKIFIAPIDALFTFETVSGSTKGKASAFQPSSEGRTINEEKVKKEIENRIPSLIAQQKNQSIILPLSITILKPKITTQDANKFGIKELLGTGTSLFYHSIPGRIYNITLASTRLNGLLIAPNETFSFDQALGDISSFTGYQKAYTIQNGKTVLGDGGGVCQVSTTMFRAALNTGLPITERHAHAYRVSYYEAEDPPGFDATIFSPTVDLKFKNDTGNYILIQTVIDPQQLRLTILFYGTKDDRKIIITKPVVGSLIPPPAPLYQDDATLPKGVVKQVDFAAWGAHVYFTRQVLKNNMLAFSDTFISDYQAWQAQYLRGTQE